MKLTLAGLALLVACAVAQAQPFDNCSQTVGITAAAVPFPAAGAVGASAPKNYLNICNAHATNTLGVNIERGGTAAIGGAGTLTLNPGGCRWWDLSSGVPATASVIGSGASTTTACEYQ
jgi:hypothetical protein